MTWPSSTGSARCPRAWLLGLPRDRTLLDQRFCNNPPKWLALGRRIPI
jgi:hypothetical protein